MMKDRKISWNPDLVLGRLELGRAGQGVPRVVRGNDFPLADAPHFLGVLIMASAFGAVACGAALVYGLSLWASLAVYSGVGATLFGTTLVVTVVLNRAPAARLRG